MPSEKKGLYTRIYGIRFNYKLCISYLIVLWWTEVQPNNTSIDILNPTSYQTNKHFEQFAENWLHNSVGCYSNVSKLFTGLKRLSLIIKITVQYSVVTTHWHVISTVFRVHLKRGKFTRMPWATWIVWTHFCSESCALPDHESQSMSSPSNIPFLPTHPSTLQAITYIHVLKLILLQWIAEPFSKTRSVLYYTAIKNRFEHVYNLS